MQNETDTHGEEFGFTVCALGDVIRDAQWASDATPYASDFYRLASRVLRKQAQADGTVLPILLYHTRIHRAYGGPEEGGWWYDVTEVVQVKRVYGWRAALRILRTMKENDPQPRHDRFSACGSHDVCIRATWHEDLIPQDDTCEPRPHYE